MSTVRKIQPVSDNYDKQLTYAEQIVRYNRAIKGGFFFEALLIDYAMLEDRLKSMIYHMAFLYDRDKTGVWKKTKPNLEIIVTECEPDKAVNQFKINSMKGKISLIRAVFLWASTTTGGYADNRFLKTLKTQCESVDIGGVLETLDQVCEWSDYRNEVIHGLLNKNVKSLDTEICKRAEDGMKYARYLDNQLKVLKKGNKIRKSVNALIK